MWNSDSCTFWIVIEVTHDQLKLLLGGDLAVVIVALNLLQSEGWREVSGKQHQKFL